MGPKAEWIAEACRNCGDTTRGRYCPSCGQRKGEVRISLGRMLADVLEDQFSINATLPRTLVAILFRPGRLTTEYLQGRIASWVPPFRLYLAASVLFFLVLSIANRTRTLRITMDQQGDSTATITIGQAGDRVSAAIDSVRREAGFPAAGDSARADSAGTAPGGRAPGSADTGAAPPFWGIRLLQQAPGDTTPWTERLIVHTGIPALDAIVVARIRELGALPADEAARQIGAATVERIPTAMFVLLPVFAALLKGLYLRRDRFYVEHFVFALHYHAFAFLAFTVMLVTGSAAVQGVLGIWLGLYLWLALKRVYAQGWLVTTGKWVALTWAYFIVLVLGLLGTAVIATLSL